MKFQFYRWYLEDFWGDGRVRRMSPEARGAYRDLLDLSWQFGALADPIRDLVASGWGDRAEALWREVQPCWHEDREGWRNKRLERERADAEGRSDHGRAGAAKRWEGHRKAQRWKALGDALEEAGGA